MAELRALDPTLVDPTALGLGAALGFLGIGLGSPGNPHILVRYMSIRDPRQLRYAAVVGTTWNVVMGAGAVLIGLVGRAFLGSVDALPGADPENLFPVLAQQHLPPVLFGIVVAAIFAAIMSTADSQLLVAASTVVRDVYEKVVRRGRPLPQRTLVIYSRVVVTTLDGRALDVIGEQRVTHFCGAPVVLNALASIAQSAQKMAGDLRLLAHENEILEPFGEGQVGSSAMAYKRNPMRSERITSLSRFLIVLSQNAAHTAGHCYRLG